MANPIRRLDNRKKAKGFSFFSNLSALTLVGVCGVVQPVWADAFTPPPKEEAISKEMLDRIKRVESRLESIDKIERGLNEQKQLPATNKDQAKKEVSSEDSLTFEQRIAFKDRLKSQYEYVGRVNGLHIVKVAGETQLLKNNEYLNFTHEQREIAKRRVVSNAFDLLFLEEEGSSDELSEKKDDPKSKAATKRDKEEELNSARERLEARRAELKEQKEQQSNRSPMRSDEYRASGSSSSSTYSESGFNASN